MCRGKRVDIYGSGGRLAFAGKDVYLAGSPALRRIPGLLKN